MVEIRVDAASKGNPGMSGAGIVIKQGGKIIEHSYPLGEMTNHEAEFHAIIKALKICQANYPDKMLAFQTDSQIVVDSMEKNYAKKEPFKSLLKRINELKQSFSYVFIKWIPSEQNKHADQLARKAIRQNKVKP